MFEYKVIVYVENALSSLILGSAKVDPVKFSVTLNQYANHGWEVVAMERENRRLYFFWERESYIVILKRPKNN